MIIPTEDFTDMTLASEDSDAPEVMHQRWCTEVVHGGGAPEVLHQRWCSRGGAQEVVHQR